MLRNKSFLSQFEICCRCHKRLNICNAVFFNYIDVDAIFYTETLFWKEPLNVHTSEPYSWIQWDNEVHFSWGFPTHHQLKLIYSLPPSVGHSAAELMQVTSGRRPGCTGCCSRHFMSPLDAEAFAATDWTASVLHTSPELSAGAICLGVKEKRLSGRSLDGTVGPELRSAGSHTSSAVQKLWLCGFFWGKTCRVSPLKPLIS